MPENETIVKLPDVLERRALKIEAAMKRRAKGDTEWIEGTLELAIELAGVREDHGGNDRAFGGWLDTRFGNRAPNHQDRAALIRWGKDPAQARILMEKTESRSIQLIDRTFTSASKDTPTPKTTRSPKTDATIEIVRAIQQNTGVLPKRDDVVRTAKVHNSTADTALRVVRAENTTTPPKPEFTKASIRHIDAQIKILDAVREATFEERVRAHIKEHRETLDRMTKEAGEKAVHYNKMINSHRAIFTETEFNNIRNCLHPDNSASESNRKDAFMAFNAKKLALTGKK
jgi:hypothetical protein